MSLGLRKDRPLSKNAFVRGRKGIGNPGCPTITIGDLSEPNPFFAGTNLDILGTATGGAAPYTFSLISGGLPTNVILVSADAETFGLVTDEGPLEFGSYTFTIGGTDANGCAITPREYTIEVWAQFINDTPQVVTILDPFLITVSGLPLIYGSGVALDSITFNYTSAVASFPNIEDPNGDFTAHLYNSPAIGDVIKAEIYDITEAYPQFATGSTPYTDSFISGSDSFTEFNGSVANGNWKIRGVDGIINSVKLVFKP